MEHLKIDDLKVVLQSNVHDLVSHIFPSARKKGREYCVGNLRGDPGESLKINPEKGIWKDFATGESGDLLDLVAHSLFSGDIKRAIEWTAEKYGLKKSGGIIMPAPVEPPYVLTHPSYGRSSRVWTIRDEEGRPLHATARFETSDGKVVLPYCYVMENGRPFWKAVAPPKPRPLYGLDRLASLPNAAVIICEGEKAADAAARLWPRYACITWTGGAESVRSADWSPLRNRRHVVLFPDNDEPGKKAMATLLPILFNKVERLYQVEVDDLPPKFDAADLDIPPETAIEWLKKRLRPIEDVVLPQAASSPPPPPPLPSVALSTAAQEPVQEPIHISTAQLPAIQPSAQPTTPDDIQNRIIDKDDFLKTAKKFLSENYTHDDTLTLRYYRGSYYHWNGRIYVEQKDDAIESKIYSWADNLFYTSNKKDVVTINKLNPSSRFVSELISAIKSIIYLDDKLDPPFFIGGNKQLDHHIIVFKNIVFNYVTKETFQHHPSFFCLWSLNVNYDEAAGEPEEWIKFINSIWEEKSSIDCLQEMMGLFLTSETKYQKAFMMIGPTRSGKGTISNIISAILGDDSCVSTTITSLTTNFGLNSFIGKTVAIIPDARISPKTNVHYAIERLLSISGEDRVNVDRKFKDPITTQIKTRFLIFSNEMPALPDVSGAITRRFIYLQMTKSFLGKEDLELKDRLTKEIDKIAMWAMKGLYRLLQTNRFTEPAGHQDMMQEASYLANPIYEFLETCTVDDRTQVTPLKDLYKAFRLWSDEVGLRYVPSRPKFTRDLRVVAPHYEVAIYRVNDTTQRCVRGLRLNATMQAQITSFP